MKKILFLLLTIICLASCDKSYICNCGYESGGPAFKKVYLIAKSDNGAERKCKNEADAGESCALQ